MHFNLHGILVLTGLLVALGILLWMSLVCTMAWTILRPPRMTAGKAIYHLRRLSPGDLGLAFEEENFRCRDDRSQSTLNISGWWIPACQPSSQCVVLIHGYADAKVGAIAWASLLHSFDMNILAIDLRAHGDSQGRFSTGGFFERQDTTQVIDQLLISRPGETRELFLFGISLGAAVAVATAALRNDIRGLILESLFADFKRVVGMHSRLLGLPDGITLRMAIALSQKISGAQFDVVKPTGLLRNIQCRLLLIIGEQDELLDAVDVASLRSAMAGHADAQVWIVTGAGHLRAMEADMEGYVERVGRFLVSAGSGR